MERGVVSGGSILWFWKGSFGWFLGGVEGGVLLFVLWGVEEWFCGFRDQDGGFGEEVVCICWGDGVRGGGMIGFRLSLGVRGLV